MHACPCSWALKICKNIGIRTYFGLVTLTRGNPRTVTILQYRFNKTKQHKVKSVGVFCHFAFWRHGTRLATFSDAPKNCIFWGAFFEPIRNLATLVPEILQDFHGTPLYHCYTLVIGCICRILGICTVSIVYFCRIAFVYTKPDRAMARTCADRHCLRAFTPQVVWKEGRQHDQTCMYRCGRFADH